MQNHIVEMRKVARKLSGFRCLLNEGQTRAGNLCGESKKSSEKGFQLFSGFAKICLGSAKDRGHDPDGSRDFDSSNPKRNGSPSLGGGS